MTFIASIIAKNGIVVLADSLTTATQQMISIDQINLLGNDADITKESLKKFLNPIPVYSHQNAEKLFELDKHTILTTAGTGTINGIIIKDLIDEFIITYDSAKSLDIRKQEFIDFLIAKCLEEIKQSKIIYGTNFILSCFNSQSNLFEIYDIKIASTTEEQITANPTHQFITSNNLTHDKMVCDGQTRITNKLLLGSSFDAKGIIQSTVKIIINSFQFTQKPTDADMQNYVEQIIKAPEMKQYMEYPKEIFHIRELEIQEAVDFICLLYKMVVDFQKYTNIFPNVGGHVKVGIIRKNIDFELVTNNKIRIPDYIE